MIENIILGLLVAILIVVIALAIYLIKKDESKLKVVITTTPIPDWIENLATWEEEIAKESSENKIQEEEETLEIFSERK